MSGKGQLLILMGVLFFLGVIAGLIGSVTHDSAVKDLALFETGERVVGKVISAQKVHYTNTRTDGASNSHYYVSLVVSYEADNGEKYKKTFRSVPLKEEGITKEFLDSYIGRDWTLIIDGKGKCIAGEIEDIYFEDRAYDTYEEHKRIANGTNIAKYIGIAVATGSAITFGFLLFLLLKEKKKVSKESQEN
jgi:hypothetical protein